MTSSYQIWKKKGKNMEKYRKTWRPTRTSKSGPQQGFSFLEIKIKNKQTTTTATTTKETRPRSAQAPNSIWSAKQMNTFARKSLSELIMRGLKYTKWRHLRIPPNKRRVWWRPLCTVVSYIVLYLLSNLYLLTYPFIFEYPSVSTFTCSLPDFHWRFWRRLVICGPKLHSFA